MPKCTATAHGTRRPERAGKPCAAWAVHGGTVCVSHGGKAPQVRRKAAERLAEARVRGMFDGGLLANYRPEPVTNPYAALADVAGRAVAFMRAAESQVAALDALAVAADGGMEHVAAAVSVFQRAMSDAGRLLAEISKLGLAERLVQLRELEADRFIRVLAGAASRLHWDVDMPAISEAVAAELEALPAEAIMSS